MALETPTVGMSNEGMYARPFEDGSDSIARGQANVGADLAKDLNSLSNTILQMQIKAEAERAEAEALSLSNKAFEELQKNQLEYAQLKNKDAIDAYDSYKQNISNILTKYTPTDEAQPLTAKLFAKRAEHLRTSSNASLMSYQMEQIASWKMSELNSALDLSLNDSLGYYGKPQFADKMSRALEQYDFIADAQGIDVNSDTYRNDRLKLTSRVHFNGIMNEINREQLGNASAHLKQYKKELTAEDYNRLLIGLEDARTRWIARNQPKEFTEADAIKHFTEVFLNSPELWVVKDEVQIGEKLDGAPITDRRFVNIDPKHKLFEQALDKFVGRQVNMWKLERKKDLTVQDKILYKSAVKINEALARGEQLPTSANQILEAIGQDKLAKPETINEIQTMLNMENANVGSAGNAIGFRQFRRRLIDGDLSFDTEEELIRHAKTYNFNPSETDQLIQLHDRLKKQPYEDSYKRYDNQIEVFINSLDIVDSRSDDPEDQYAYAQLDNHIRKELELRRKDPLNKDKDFLEIFMQYKSDLQTIGHLKSRGKEWYDKAKEDMPRLESIPTLTREQYAETLSFVHAEQDKNKGISFQEAFDLWRENEFNRRQQEQSHSITNMSMLGAPVLPVNGKSKQIAELQETGVIDIWGDFQFADKPLVGYSYNFNGENEIATLSDSVIETINNGMGDAMRGYSDYYTGQRTIDNPVTDIQTIAKNVGSKALDLSIEGSTKFFRGLGDLYRWYENRETFDKHIEREWQKFIEKHPEYKIEDRSND